MGMSSEEARTARKTSKVRMVTPLVPEMAEVPKWKMKDTFPMYKDTSIIDVLMGVVSIPFSAWPVMKTEDNENGDGVQRMTGNQRVLQDLFEGEPHIPVIMDQERPAEMTDAHMSKDIAVLPADH